MKVVHTILYTKASKETLYRTVIASVWVSYLLVNIQPLTYNLI